MRSTPSGMARRSTLPAAWKALWSSLQPAGLWPPPFRGYSHPVPLEQIGWGLAISLLASLINLLVAQRLLRAGRTYRSITLEADARHLMTDVWTSVGVLTGIGLVALTGWTRLDPLLRWRWPPTLSGPASGWCAAPCWDCLIPRSQRRIGRRSKCAGTLPARSTASRRMRCAPERQEPAASSPSTFWFLGTGPCTTGISCWSRSSTTFATPSRTRRCLRIWNLWMTRHRLPTRTSSAPWPRRRPTVPSQDKQRALVTPRGSANPAVHAIHVVRTLLFARRALWIPTDTTASRYRPTPD